MHLGHLPLREVARAGPCLGLVAHDGTREPEQRTLRREDLHHARAALDFPVGALLHVVGAQALPVRRFQKAVQRGNTSRVISSLVKPLCLIVDEVGRCVYDRPCTDLFFDVVDRRYEKEGPNAMVLTSNIAPSGWDEFFTGDDTLLCALDRLFDKASVFVMRGPSCRGMGLDTYSVEAVPQAVKVRGIQPEGM